MLESITVKNLALIKESRIQLHEGLNILTGETGAGKSIILGSVRLALGERAGKDVIRTGADHAMVELVFTDKSEEVIQCMKELELPAEEDGSIFISRRIQEGRSVAKCNGEMISGRDLKRLAALLIDIHGQNDTRELLDVSNYMDILDEFGADSIGPLLDKMKLGYKEYKAIEDELKEAAASCESRDKDISLAQFEVQEIENARLSTGEDEELEERYAKMKNAGRIAEGLSKVSSALSDEGGVSDILGSAQRELGSLTQYDTNVSNMLDGLATSADMIDGLLRDIQGYMDEMEFSEAEFRETENRLDTINHLKNKYGSTIEDVLKYAEDKSAYLEKMQDMDAYMSRLNVKRDEAHKKAMDIACKLHDARVETAKSLCGLMTQKLKELSFENVSMDIEVSSDEGRLGVSGIDDTDILVSFNKGEPVRSLSQVASGGELSRFMLALKEVTAIKGGVDTLVFDEIDAGISGRTAWNVSGSMKKLAATHQVIAITHLPQIAARADRHYLIEKHTEDDSTVTDIRELKDEEKVEEIARLLSGGELTKAGLVNARELIESAL